MCSNGRKVEYILYYPEIFWYLMTGMMSEQNV